jgi:hypothetical protein
MPLLWKRNLAMTKNRFWVILILLTLAACQPVPAVSTAGVTVVPMASSTPGISGERQKLEGYFSFITPEAYIAELEDDSVFFSDETKKIFISLAIIGVGEDGRTAQGLIDSIFVKFEGHEIIDPSDTTVGGLAGTRADFSGVLGSTVVSGNYVVIDLGEGVSFFAFGMGNVEAEIDTWESYGRLNFTQLLNTVEISFGSY